MTYRCGMGNGMAQFGFTPGPPRVTCDGDGCGLVMEAKVTRGGAPAWLRNGKAPPGWKKIMNDDGTSRDYCPRCKNKSGKPPRSEDRGGEGDP